MLSVDEMAYEAGFRKVGERLTSNTATDPAQALGMDIVSSPIMPEGYVALRTERGAMVVGPKGSYWVPFWPPFTSSA